MPHSVPTNHPKKSPRSLIVWLALQLTIGCLTVHAQASDAPWLLSFTDIRVDSHRAYFLGSQWIGYYVPGPELMYTVPRDSIDIPEPSPPVTSVNIGKYAYAPDGSGIARVTAKGDSTLYSLPEPSPDALSFLAADASQHEVSAASSRETIHSIAAVGEQVWFGLLLFNADNTARAAGLGWFDTKTRRFGRIYTPELTGYSPEWIGIAADTLNALFVSTLTGARRTKFLRLSLADNALNEVDLRGMGIPDAPIVQIRLWDDTLLFTTSTTIAVWKPGRRADSWSTRMYAARNAIPLYLVTFTGDSGLVQDTVRFQLLRPSKPSTVKIEVGDWMEIVAPEGIEGYVDDETWRANQNLWAERFWNCGDSLCFARIRVPTHGGFVQGDFIHAPLTYLGKDANGIKIGFRAAWARKEDLLPVLMPR